MLPLAISEAERVNSAVLERTLPTRLLRLPLIAFKAAISLPTSSLE